MDKLKILVVDDEEEFVSALVERLSLRDIVAIGTTDGRGSIEKVRNGDFNVVILDVKMPGINGLEVLQELLEIKPELIVFIITGYGSTAYGEEGVKEGAYAYLPKPIKINELIQMMTEAVAGKGEEQ